MRLPHSFDPSAGFGLTALSGLRSFSSFARATIFFSFPSISPSPTALVFEHSIGVDAEGGGNGLDSEQLCNIVEAAVAFPRTRLKTWRAVNPVLGVHAVIQEELPMLLANDGLSA